MSTHQRYAQHMIDLQADVRPQREWGEGRGLFLVIGHFVVGVAGGTWLMSLIYGMTAGFMLAFCLATVGGFVHLLFLGRPERAYKMVRHLKTSWISRGFIGLSIFLAGNILYLMTICLSLTGPWLLVGRVGELLALLGTATIIGYMGFCYTASKAIPFWHSPLHPAVYIAYALRGGVAMLLVIGAVAGGMDSPTTEGLLKLWISVTAIVTLFFLLEIHSAWTSGNFAARESVRQILAGRLALGFYGGTLAVGLIVPALLIAFPFGQPSAAMALIGMASVVGDFFMKLSTVKAGVYLLQHFAPRRQRT